jgi:hypothetical protein
MTQVIQGDGSLVSRGTGLSGLVLFLLRWVGDFRSAKGMVPVAERCQGVWK